MRASARRPPERVHSGQAHAFLNDAEKQQVFVPVMRRSCCGGEARHSNKTLLGALQFGLDDQSGAEFACRKHERRIFELFGNRDCGHQSRQGAVDVFLLLEGVKVRRRQCHDLGEPPGELWQREDPALDGSRIEQAGRHLGKLNADQPSLSLHERRVGQLLPQGRTKVPCRRGGIGRAGEESLYATRYPSEGTMYFSSPPCLATSSMLRLPLSTTASSLRPSEPTR